MGQRSGIAWVSDRIPDQLPHNLFATPAPLKDIKFGKLKSYPAVLSSEAYRITIPSCRDATPCVTPKSGEGVQCYPKEVLDRSYDPSVRRMSPITSQEIDRKGYLSLSLSVWSHQYGETGLIPAPKVPDLYRTPSMST